MKDITMVLILRLETISPLLLLLIHIAFGGQTDQHKLRDMNMLIKMTGLQQPADCSEFLDNLEVNVINYNP